MPASFVLDTSAFINSWNHHYRLPVFAGVWAALEDAIAAGTVVAPTEVFVEIGKRSGDELHTWCTANQAAFVPPAASWGGHIAALQHHAPHWFQGGGQHEADPFVVALAMDQRLPVVTYEGTAFNGNAAKVKTYRRSMPHVCALAQVDVATMFDLLHHLAVVL